MLALGKFDISAGWGVTRVHEVPGDVIADPTTGMPATSILKQRVGIAGGVVYHFSDFLHFDIDYFLASRSGGWANTRWSTPSIWVDAQLVTVSRWCARAHVQAGPDLRRPGAPEQ